MHSRLRFLLWLTLLLPIAAISVWALHTIDRAHDERVAATLEDGLQLESARLVDALAGHAADADALARDGGLADALAAPGAGSGAGGERAAPLQSLSERLLDGAASTDTGFVALQVLDTGGRTLGSAGRNTDRATEGNIGGGTGRGTGSGMDISPDDRALVTAAITGRRPAFGRVRTAGPIEDALLPIAVAVSPDADATGALLLHVRLAPLVEPLSGHHALGDSTEVYLVQRTASGENVPISPLRFAPVMPSADGSATPLALPPPAAFANGAVRAVDYRGVDTVTAVRTLEPVDWRLVAKVDLAEANAPLSVLHRTALATIAALVLMLAGIWLFMLLPLGRRMRRTAEAAGRISQGRSENPINDAHVDEIGDVARSIDRLATDLDSDRRQRALAEARLRHQSMHDDLTGLVNRRQAHAVIDTLSETPSRIASLVFLDLDAFKTVNDLHGHAVGDEVLVALSRRLESAIDTDATLARWGGDQFLVILPDTSAEDARRVAARVRALFDHPIGTSAGRHRLECSLGVASSDEQRPLDDMLGEVEAALSSERRFRHTAGSVDAFAARSVSSALEERRVEMWMQPIVQVPTPGRARPVGAEALVRLRSRDGGIIPPGDFMSAVRKTPLGRTLDDYMMERCTEALARWRRAGVVDDAFRLSINITGASLREPSLAADLGQRLAVQGVPAANLVIEISEKTGDVDERLLDNLRHLGVGIALDDVGLEHSNIDRLVALSPDIAKLDRQWLDDPVVLPRLVDLCRELGMQLVAEGVETHVQLARLQGLSVTRFQGYLFDRPRPAVQFVERWGRLSGTSRATGGELSSGETLSVVG